MDMGGRRGRRASAVDGVRVDRRGRAARVSDKVHRHADHRRHGADGRVVHGTRKNGRQRYQKRAGDDNVRTSIAEQERLQTDGHGGRYGGDGADDRDE